MVEGVDYEVTYENNIEIGKAKAYINGIGLYTGKKTVEFDIIDKNFKYRIISEPSANAKYGKVEVVGLVNKNHKKVKIKNTVAFAGKKYKITSIAKKAFFKKGKEKVKFVVPKNIKKAYKKLFKF